MLLELQLGALNTADREATMSQSPSEGSRCARCRMISEYRLSFSLENERVKLNVSMPAAIARPKLGSVDLNISGPLRAQISVDNLLADSLVCSIVTRDFGLCNAS